MTDNPLNPSPRQEKMAVHACSGCGKAFAPTKGWQRFCSSGCRDNFHNRRKREIESPPVFDGNAAGENQDQSTNPSNPTRPSRKIKPDSKVAGVLRALAAGQTFNRFQAEKILHDHCLPSTVSAIQKLGIVVSRKDEIVRGFNNSKVHCCRYWLSTEMRERAAEVLGYVCQSQS